MNAQVKIFEDYPRRLSAQAQGKHHAAGRSIVQKIWELWKISSADGVDILGIGLQLLHEVTSPPAFSMLRQRELPVWFPLLQTGTEDHIVPTKREDRSLERIKALGESSAQMQGHYGKAHALTLAFRESGARHGIPMYPMGDARQGIVHVIGPELGLTQPGLTIVCGDSHTSTHGAFGALAFGIGSTQVAQALAYQALPLAAPKICRVLFKGKPGPGVTPKDMILAFISKYGVSAGTGCFFEYTGEAIDAMSMEGRMTICNMSIEAGARAGLINPDDTTYAFMNQRPFAPKGSAFNEAQIFWNSLRSDKSAQYDHTLELDIANIEPWVTWGDNPGLGVGVSGQVPDPKAQSDPDERDVMLGALSYMGLKAGMPVEAIEIDQVFVGSCTNSRIQDLRDAAHAIQGRKVSPHVRMMVVPGSVAVQRQAEKEGLDQIFKTAGAEFRDAGCSMCLGMNPDLVPAGKYCVSTSNRNFQGRQGIGSRTILASPQTAIASAIAGHVADPRKVL
jgi:3-isopropylmalate/(R)-2-methylmalate dehydratase large subunit